MCYHNILIKNLLILHIWFLQCQFILKSTIYYHNIPIILLINNILTNHLLIHNLLIK
uniref:Candidate secreted effector n=1 Tax=Meloidogyne incognita TaxID=6306 RepID=A0A914LJE3_MELIC